MKPPAVTVLMAMYNAAAHLRAAIGSVVAQTFRDFELVIVDDGSTDDSVAIAESFRDARLRLIRNSQNKGQTACLNQGLALARGEWVARQDADDLSHPRRLEAQMRRLCREPPLVLLGSAAWIVDEGGKFMGLLDVPLGPQSIEWAALWENPFIHTAVIFRREVVASLGGYDASFRICQDFDLWMRIAQNHATANLPERLVTYRYSPNSLQHGARDTVDAEVRRVLERVLAHAFSRAVSAEEIAAMMRFRAGLRAGALPGFRAAYAELLGAYRGAHPASGGPEFRRTLARHGAKCGRDLLSERPLAGLREIARAFLLDPSLVLSLLTARVAGRFTVSA